MIDRSHFKYNLKKNKYTIRLTDVFLKTMEGEVYLNEMNVETEKMEKSMIPPQFHYKWSFITSVILIVNIIDYRHKKYIKHI
jgi:proteasome lid subunit RPN8/RPN11